MAAVHVLGGHVFVRRAGVHHIGVLRNHHQNNLVERVDAGTGRWKVSLPQRECRPGQPAGQLPGHHPAGQGENRQDDHRDCDRVRALLVAVHRVRSAAGV
uniref:(northern house mosquito) hypothetical protein n=1 Tax=Culex pipiens TaxID=7175 RepID=A0A8D8GWW8_CULPI